MTLAEIQAAWETWSHRRDVQANLDDVTEFAQGMVGTRARNGATFDDVLATSPETVLSAGLISLLELAMDDEGLARERGLFNTRMENFSLKRSVDTFTPSPFTIEETV